ncbi:MAG: NfeD family protein, partial [Vicinamibacteraceae bacterium]
AVAAQEPKRLPFVLVAEVDGIIHPVTAEFLANAIDRADTSGAAALVVELRTPGGLVESTRTIISRMIAARTPVVIFVGPAGARAASAGFYLTLAADVVVMAPGTHIGAAHPATIGGSSGGAQEGNKTMEEKAASDLAAYARSLAEARGRNVALSDEAVRKSRSFTEREALNAKPPLIDFIASDVDEVIRQLDGRQITRFNDQEMTLRTAGARVEHLAPNWRQRFLGAIAHPQIAVLLFSLGMLGLTVELWYPGSIVPGVVGGLCLLLAFLAFQVLPINVTGLLLIGLGLGLLVLELKMPSFGALGVGGAVSLVLGWIVMIGNAPGMTVSLGLVVPVSVAFAAIFVFLGRLALASQRQPAVTGTAGMVRSRGRALTEIPTSGVGTVSVHGEIWSATAQESIPRDAPVEVVAIDGLTLTVRPINRSSPGGSAS